MKFKFLILSLFILVLSANLVLAQNAAKSQKIVNFFIFQPTTGTKVKHICQIAGKVKKYDKDKSYRIVITPHALKNYHPQSGKIVFDKNGNFNGTAYIGTAGGSIGEKFDILIVETETDGNDKFDNYILEASKTGNWSGISSLPENSVEVARVKDVVRE